MDIRNRHKELKKSDLSLNALYSPNKQKKLPSFKNLNIFKLKKVLQKIPVHFSFARALQGSAITLHCEKNAPETVQKCIAHRCKMCHLATKGEYKQELEGEYTKSSQNSNFVANNNY